MADAMKLPPGATLVSDGPAMKLPPGATLVTAPQQTLDPSQPGMQPAKSISQSVGDFAKEWWDQVNPVEGVKGLAQAAAHPIGTAGSMGDAQAQLAYKARDAFKKGNYVEGVRHALNYMVPILGPQTDRAGDLADQGEYAKAAGATAGLATNIAAPELIKKVPVAAIASKAAPVAEKVYQSALKPSIAANSPTEIQSMVRTGLDNAIPISEAGSQKLAGLISDLDDKVKAKIAAGANAGATIDPKAVAARADEVKGKFANQVNPTSDLAAIDASKQEFLDNAHVPPGPGPYQWMKADAAQTMKQGTYAQLKSRAYGELSSATVESQKALARGIKEELEAQFPEIKSLNAEQGKAIGLDEALDKAVQRINNRDVFGLGPKIASTGAGAAAGIMTGSVGAVATVATVSGILQKVIGDPAVQSRIAIAIDRASKMKSLSAMTGRARVVGYLNALGNSVDSAQNTQQPKQ